MLDWLENTGVARLVQESTWGYPIVLSSHAVGMAVLAGIVLMINFRVLTPGWSMPLPPLQAMYRVALAGLVINVISGLMLFVANADAFVESTPFLIKIGLLVIAITLLVMMARRLFGTAGLVGRTVMAGATGYDARGETTSRLKVMAAVSTIAWFGVIITGRLIAYWDWKDF